jgi:beta-glucanase (GH16 family)
MPMYNTDIHPVSEHASFVPEGYRLVWGDEFEETAIDRTKWCFHSHMHGQSDLILLQDERAVKIENGSMHLLSDRISEDTFSTNYSLSTADTMVFRYGYLEMRAKLPMHRPAFPSFWMQSSKHGAKAPEVMGEIDILEYFSQEDPHIQTGIHKWYRDNIKDHFLCPHVGRAHFESREVGEQFHCYGLLWDPAALRFMVDGQVYLTIDITEKADFGTREGSNMDCFHDFYYLIFNNYLMTPKFSGSTPEIEVRPDDTFPIDYEIDYVRLYQKEGEGEVANLSAQI